MENVRVSKKKFIKLVQAKIDRLKAEEKEFEEMLKKVKGKRRR
jgi:hypothetical protein